MIEKSCQPSDMSEVGFSPRRMKASAQMRSKAKELEDQARDWRALADALDTIEKNASEMSADGCEGGSHIGVGSQAERFLWALAAGYIK